MISIFNGRRRTLGQAEQSIWAQIDVGFRKHLHLFKGAKLAVFMAIALHSDERGWAYPSIDLLSRETGYDDDTIRQALAGLCKIIIDGQRVLLKGQPRAAHGRWSSNTYLIFPTPTEVTALVYLAFTCSTTASFRNDCSGNRQLFASSVCTAT